MAPPSATGRTVATVLDMLAAVTSLLLDETVYDSPSPSESAKLFATSTVAADPPSVIGGYVTVFKYTGNASAFCWK